MAEAAIIRAIAKISIALAKKVGGQAGVLKDLHGSMDRIESKLKVVQKFLGPRDIRNYSNDGYECWLKSMRKVVYHIEDMVDKYLSLHAQVHSNVGWTLYLKNPKTARKLSKIASEVKKTEDELTRQYKIRKQWVLTTNSYDSSNSGWIVDSVRQASKSRSLEEEDLVGIEDNKQKLQNWLGDNKLARAVIVLHGMGGLGKTALAAVVYKMEREKFDCHAWIPVSQDYKKEDVVKRVIAEVFRGKNSAPCDFDAMDLADIIERLKKYLEEKKYLFVLDDVWQPEAYTELFEGLSNLKGSRIVITTRNQRLANRASPDRILELKPLSDDDSLKLFHKKAFPCQKCPEELENISKDIVDKCKGLPLAIGCIGSLCCDSDKSKEVWKGIHDQLSHEIINNESLGPIKNVLYLSFFHLDACLQSCFLHCSLFPEDYIFHRKKSIRLWMAEGFIEKRGQSTVEEVAEGFLKELVQRNMLQIFETNSFGRIRSFRMHDIVRELAVDLCQRESFGVTYQEECGDGGKMKDGRRLAVHKLKKDIQCLPLGEHPLRSIITLDNSMPSSNLVATIAKKCKYLSVMELSGVLMEEVPGVIGDLFNLRHLGLRNSKVNILPSTIEKLSELLTLDLSGCDILELPRGITKLKKLRHLFAEKNKRKGFRWGRGVCIPIDVGNLTDLQTLQAVEVEDDESVRRLGELRQIRSIRIWNVKGILCENLYSSLNEMRHLSNLYITASDEDEVLGSSGLDQLPPSLQKLCLRGRLMDNVFESPDLLAAAGQNMNSLTLCWSQLREDPLPCLSRLSYLKQLRLKRAYIGEKLVFLRGWFPHLKELYLTDLPSLKLLLFDLGTMPRLEVMYLMDLASMTELPVGIEFMLLNTLHIHGAMTPELDAKKEHLFRYMRERDLGMASDNMWELFRCAQQFVRSRKPDSTFWEVLDFIIYFCWSLGFSPRVHKHNKPEVDAETNLASQSQYRRDFDCPETNLASQYRRDLDMASNTWEMMRCSVLLALQRRRPDSSLSTRFLVICTKVESSICSSVAGWPAPLRFIICSLVACFVSIPGFIEGFNVVFTTASPEWRELFYLAVSCGVAFVVSCAVGWKYGKYFLPF